MNRIQVIFAEQPVTVAIFMGVMLALLYSFLSTVRRTQSLQNGTVWPAEACETVCDEPVENDKAVRVAKTLERLHEIYR